MNLDLTTLTPVQFAAVLVIVAAVDFVSGVFGALRAGNFQWSMLVDIVESHGLNRIIPIGALFAVGVVGNVSALCFAADGLLAAYVVETIVSVNGNLNPAPAKA